MNIMHRCMMIAVAAASVVIPAYSQSRPYAGTITIVPPVIHTSAAGSSFSSVHTAPYGRIYFSTPDRNISGRNSRTSVAVGLRYDRGDLGVQGIEMTIDIPNAFVAVEGVGFGTSMKSPGEWTLDYHVRRTQGGSTLKIIAFGRDSAAGIGAGSYDDLFRVSLSVDGPGAVPRGGEKIVAEMAIVEVASALAHSLGHSAGIVPAPERSLLRLTLVPPITGGGRDAADGYHSPVDAAGAILGERTPITADVRESRWRGESSARTPEVQSPRME